MTRDDVVREFVGGFLTLDETAALLAVSRTSIYRLMRRNELPWVRVGGVRRVPKKAVNNLIERALAGSDVEEAPGNHGQLEQAQRPVTTKNRAACGCQPGVAELTAP